MNRFTGDINIGLAFTWMLVSIIMAYAFTEGTVLMHNLFSILCMVSYFFCFRNWVRSGGRVVSLYTFFVFYMFLSNLGQSVLYLFMVPKELLTIFYRFSIDQIVPEIRFQLLCVSALNLGTCLYVGKSGVTVSLSQQVDTYKHLLPTKKKYDTIFDVFLFASLAYFLLVCVRMIAMRQTMGYAEFFESGRGVGEGLLVNLAKFFSLTLTFWALFSKRHTTVIYVSLLLIIIVTNLVGARGLSISYIAILLIALPVTHPQWFKRRTIWIWAISGFLAFASLSIISTTRQSELSSDVLASEYGMGYNAMATVSEMGRSAGPTIYTMEADGGEFRTPSILVDLVRAFIPLSSRLSIVKENNFNLSDWVTDLTGNSNSGLGFSCVAEVFLNLGWFGWIIMIFHGYLIAYAENRAYRGIMVGRYAYAVCLLAILCSLIPWARGEFLRVIAALRYTLYLVLYLWMSHKKI